MPGLCRRSRSRGQMLLSSYCHRPVQNITAHNALILLRFSFSVPRLMHTESAVRQRSLDAPGVAREWNTIWKSSLGGLDKARLVALKASYSCDWLFFIPIISFGFRLSDKAIRVAVGLRLGLNISEPHTCWCGDDVCARGHMVFRARKVVVGQQPITKSMTLYGEHYDAPISPPRTNPRVF